MSIYTDGTYAANNPTFHADHCDWKARQVAAILRDNNITYSRLVDVGCGSGGVVRYFAATHPEAMHYGVDISPQALALCKQYPAPSNAQFSSEFDPNVHPDVVTLLDVLEHVENPWEFLRRFRAVPYVVIHFPLDAHVLGILRGTPMRLRQDVGHIHLFTRETALSFVRECGLTVIDERFTPGALELPKRRPIGNRLNPLRRVLFAFAPHLAARTLGGFPLLVLTKGETE